MRVYKPRNPDIDLPLLDIPTFLFESNWTLAKEETKIQIEAANPSNYITKAEARDLLKRLAYVLREQYGIGATGSGKDVVLLLCSGSPLLPVLFYSIVAAGGVFSGAGTAYKAGEVARQVADADAQLLICSREYESLSLQVAKQCGIPRERVLVVQSETRGHWTLLSNGYDILKHGNGKSLDWRRMTDQKQLEDTTICVLYSSGTTGLPKGVRLSHRAIMSSCVCSMDPARRYQAANPDFVFDTIAHLPMANIAGIDMYCTNPIYMGGSTYWMKNYDFDSFIEYHRRFEPGYQFTVPPIWLRIAKSNQVTDHFDGLHVAVTGSAPIGYATAMEVQAKLGKGRAVFTQTWGITECSGVITALDWFGNKTWSVGDAIPNTRLRILDPDGKDIDPESKTPGEMLVGGAIVAQGYHNRPDATAEAFITDEQGERWYRTGDIGMIEDGHVYIVDRLKELIKYKGSQVAPAELEALLTSHPDIADAAVIGVWEPSQETEVPRAYVVRRRLAAGKCLTAREVAEFVKQNVAGYKQLRGGVYFTEEIPKSASGKILRKELREKAGEAAKPKL